MPLGRPLAAAVALCVAASTAEAASRPVVLELFTSEGCSSCPPADAFLSKLADRPDLLPLAFHVTYWNALGWRDPYSSEAATSRQALYAMRLGGGSYTPEMVVDGRSAMVGSERGEVAAAIAVAREQIGETVPVRLARAGNDIAITIGPGAGRGRVMLIGFDSRRETKVGRGENGGRTLVESNIVRSIRTIGDYEATALSLTVPSGDGDGTAVLIQGFDGTILGAARL